MRTQLAAIRKYYFPYARQMVGALVLNLAGLVFNAGSLALMAAMTQMVLNAAGMLAEPSEASVPGGAMPISLDLNQWYGYLSQQLDAWLASHGLLWTLATLAGVYLVARLLDAAAEISGLYLLWSVRSRAAQQMMNDLFAHISELSMDFFNRSRVGALSSRISVDVDQYATELYKMVTGMLMSLPFALFYWVTLVRTNAQLSLIAVAAFSVSYFVVQRLSKYVRGQVIRLGDALAGVGAAVQEAFSGIVLVKAYAAEKHEQDRMSDKLAASLGPAINRGMFQRGRKPVNRVLQDIPAVLVLLYGAYLILSGSIDIATFILFVYLLRQVRPPTIDLVTDLYLASQLAEGYAHRLDALWGERPSVPDGQVPVANIEQSLALENVSFKYEAQDAEVTLDGIDLAIRNGEVVALVGPSGAGKSTLVSLLLRFYDPTQGRVLLDGQDIRQFQIASYRALFGVVTQETILFHDSVRNNIAYGLAPEAVSDEEVEAAARVANAHDFIAELPEGYDTVVGDRGLRLSGGQRQRLAIARAVLRNPSILIFDEATSSLDSESELLVQEAIERLLTGRTAVVIAHRLSTIRNADRIVVMEGGRMVESGTHDELLARDGTYRRLYESQYLQDATLPEISSA